MHASAQPPLISTRVPVHACAPTHTHVHKHARERTAHTPTLPCSHASARDHTSTRACRNTRTRTPARTGACRNTHARVPTQQMRARPRRCNAACQPHAYARTHAHTHARPSARKHPHPHSHTHTHRAAETPTGRTRGARAGARRRTHGRARMRACMGEHAVCARTDTHGAPPPVAAAHAWCMPGAHAHGPPSGVHTDVCVRAGEHAHLKGPQ